MESSNSFRGYGKVDKLEEQEFQQKRRKRLIIIFISSCVLVSIIIAAVAGTLIHKRHNNEEDDSSNSAPQLSPAASLTALCAVTRYPDSCYSAISSLEAASNTTNPEILFKLSLHVAINELSKLAELPSKVMAETNDTQLKAALSVCETLFEDAIEKLNDSISSMEVNLILKSKTDDIKTWLSTSITDQETCLDALRDINASILSDVKTAMKNSTEFSSNSLAIVSKIMGLLSEFAFPLHRKLLGHGDLDHSDNNFPSWVMAADRRLLQVSNPAADKVVAKGGGGDYETIKEAVEAVPAKSERRFVIYVKAGTYLENVILDNSKWNVMIYGDGKTKTIVSGRLNFKEGTPTFSTATFAAVGKGFIAKDMKFINTAGPQNHQAVALRSSSDRSVFYKCSFEAFQDTLFAHSNRQFYRDCDISGTVDFIFGNAAAVIQNSVILPRQPLPHQFNAITAQGKSDPNQNTGFSIQKCALRPFDKSLTAETYFGRPWKEFSTAVVMESDIGSFLNPLGWIEWAAGIEPPKTVFYGEYRNTGPGSSVAQRVKWAGYRPSLTEDEARKFSVGSFIQGSEWLPQTSVAFDLAL